MALFYFYKIGESTVFKRHSLRWERFLFFVSVKIFLKDLSILYKRIAHKHPKRIRISSDHVEMIRRE